MRWLSNLNDGIPDDKSDNEDDNDLEEIVDGVLQIEEEVSPSLVRPEWELMGYRSRLHTWI